MLPAAKRWARTIKRDVPAVYLAAGVPLWLAPSFEGWMV